MIDYSHLEPTPRARQHGVNRLRRLATGLLEFLDLNAPDTVLALQVAALHDAATLALGIHYWAELGRRQVGVTRQHSALCQHCDNGVAVSLSHPPVCEQCEAKFEELDAEYRLDGEGGNGEGQ